MYDRAALGVMSPSDQSLLEVVTDMVRVAGEAALRHFRNNLTVERKSDGSEVTIADRAAEHAVRDWIEARFPTDSVLGEELPPTERSPTRRWYIDPIDGTKSFVRGVPLWGSMVALEVSGEIVAGGIRCPVTDDTVVAVRGSGCWHNGTRAHVSITSSIADATIVATDVRFPSHHRGAERWSALADRVAIARSWGDCYGYVLVATGRAELMADDRLHPWDVAPLLPIIAEAGGVLSDWSGRPDCMGPDGIASNAALAAALRSALGVPSPVRRLRTVP
jgi:histidinol-phosphatase